MMQVYTVCKGGEYIPDDGLRVELPTDPELGWWALLQVGRCPDCGGDWAWWEAGYVPGTRRCVGVPLGGRPTDPLTDRRVPSPDGDPKRGHAGQFPQGARGERARALWAQLERGEGDPAELVALLYPWCRLTYEPHTGCGSFFTVLGAQYDPDGGEDARSRNVAVLRRERFWG